jgi:hypothetical protein
MFTSLPVVVSKSGYIPFNDLIMSNEQESMQPEASQTNLKH